MIFEVDCPTDPYELDLLVRFSFLSVNNMWGYQSTDISAIVLPNGAGWFCLNFPICSLQICILTESNSKTIFKPISVSEKWKIKQRKKDFKGFGEKKCIQRAHALYSNEKKWNNGRRNITVDDFPFSLIREREKKKAKIKIEVSENWMKLRLDGENFKINDVNA